MDVIAGLAGIGIVFFGFWVMTWAWAKQRAKRERERLATRFVRGAGVGAAVIVGGVVSGVARSAHADLLQRRAERFGKGSADSKKH